MQLFGFEFRRTKPQDIAPSFVTPETGDGAVEIAAGGAYGTYVDLDGTVRTEAELVTKYREMSLQPEIDAATDEIVNEMIDISEDDVVDIQLDHIDQLSDNIKKEITKEFKKVLNFLDFNRRGYEIIRRWYIDGRLYYHTVIDEKNPKLGIQEVRYVDPRKIRKIREIEKMRIPGQPMADIVIPRVKNEYFIFNEKGFNYGNKSVGPSTTGLKIAKDAVVNVQSGLTDTQGTMVLSYLHKGIKALNQLRVLEDALVIYRLARAPERRIWYIDVGNLPKIKAEQYVRDIMVKHKNRLIYDGSSGEVRDDRKFMCYSLDTKIPLLDGRTLTLQDIMDEYQAGKKNWVYSCDPVTGKFVPGPVSWAGITKRDSQVVRVTFDNGKSVVCTPDHKFPVWGEGLVEAKDLVGKSIIPGYRRMKQITTGGAEYEQIYKNDTKTWEFTHREVAAWKKDHSLHEEFLFSNEYYDRPKKVIHHKDFDRLNNSPDNIVYMNHKDHLDYHHDIQSIVYTDDIMEIIEASAGQMLTATETIEQVNLRADISAWRTVNVDRNPKNRNIEVMDFSYKDLLRVIKSRGYKSWKPYVRMFDLRDREANGRLKRGSTDKGSSEWKARLSEIAKERVSYSSKTWKVTDPDGNTEIVENLSEFCRNHFLNLNGSNMKNVSGSYGYRAEELRNHKAVSVEFLDEKIDVGCLTVDLNETYHSHHTYLLDAGVYTKNTMLDDYWLPRREGGRGTEVTTLPGGQTLGQMDDVLYFQKKLYQTLNVPVNRLNSDALFSLGRATEVTRDELKFDRFITRLRSRFSSLFLKILEKQVVLKQIMTIEDWQLIEAHIKFNYAKDNYFTELKDAEVLENRVNLMALLEQSQMIGKYYSRDWARKHVLQQSEEDIEQQDEQIEEEGSDQDLLNQQAGDESGAGGEDQPAVQPLTGDEDAPPPEDKDKIKKIREAKVKYDILMKKTNKSLQDESELKKVSQIVAKNK